MTAELIELNPVICRQESLVAMPACVRRRTTEIVVVYCATCPHRGRPTQTLGALIITPEARGLRDIFVRHRC